MNIKKFFQTFAISTAILLVISFAVGFHFISNMNIGGGEDIEELDRAEPNSRQNIVVFGTDKGETRSDVIMIFSISKKQENINLISIPRDTKVKIGNGYQKINAAMAIGQENLAVQKVKEVTGIPIHDYVTLNFDAVVDIVDELGGVDFNVPQNMDYEDPYQDLYIHLRKGQQHMDGKKAIQLLRYRKYAMADIQRTSVQRDFIKALFEQKLKITNIDKVPAIYKAVNKNIKSSMNFQEILSYAKTVYDMKEPKFNTFEIPYTLSNNFVNIDYSKASEILNNNFK